MILPDTSIWIEYLRGHEPYCTSLAGHMENGKVVALSWVFGEILQGTRDAGERRTVLAYWRNLPKAGVDDDEVWLRAGLLAAAEKYPSRGVGLIDAAIVVAAGEAGAQVWTLDKPLARVLPPVMRFGG